MSRLRSVSPDRSSQLRVILGSVSGKDTAQALEALRSAVEEAAKHARCREVVEAVDPCFDGEDDLQRQGNAHAVKVYDAFIAWIGTRDEGFFQIGGQAREALEAIRDSLETDGQEHQIN